MKKLVREPVLSAKDTSTYSSMSQALSPSNDPGNGEKGKGSRIPQKVTIQIKPKFEAKDCDGV